MQAKASFAKLGRHLEAFGRENPQGKPRSRFVKENFRAEKRLRSATKLRKARLRLHQRPLFAQKPIKCGSRSVSQRGELCRRGPAGTPTDCRRSAGSPTDCRRSAGSPTNCRRPSGAPASWEGLPYGGQPLWPGGSLATPVRRPALSRFCRSALPSGRRTDACFRSGRSVRRAGRGGSGRVHPCRSCRQRVPHRFSRRGTRRIR